MAATFRFHPEALFEYGEASVFYLRSAPVELAEGFMNTVEAALASIVAAPARWRVVEEPAIRRYVLHRFPFVIYYRWTPSSEQVVIYALMHCSREPGYWRTRLARST